MISKPLVSIGVPTCDRAFLLERALTSLTAQNYPAVEIIISDNASTDDTPEICLRMLEQFPFIRYYRTENRVSANENFKNVLLLARGQYFMWAADDDLWEPDYITTLVDQISTSHGLALVAAEAQYMLHDGTKLPFFREGSPFYKPSPNSQLIRLLRIAAHNYGNLIYGLYRREVLLTNDGEAGLDYCKFINEIPILIWVAARGGIQVSNRVLFYKTTSLQTYLQAAREYGVRPVLDQQKIAKLCEVARPAVDGPTSRRPDLFTKVRRLVGSTKSLLGWPPYSVGLFLYHAQAWADIRRTMCHIDASFTVKLFVLIVFLIRLSGHCVKLSVVWPLQDLCASKNNSFKNVV